MNKTNKNNLLIFLTGVLLGVLCFILIYGVKVLDFTYDGWLKQGTGFTGDLTQHYMGWVYYKDSPLSFPMGLMENLSYPEKISIIYTDSIPLLAVFFKIFAGILPSTFQYFGLWGLICFALQGGFACLILKKFSDSNIFCIIASLFFILSPIVFARMFYHSALAAHWLILASLYAWISWRDIKTLNMKLLVWCGLTIGCVMINLYFAPMVLGILFCASLEEFLENKEIFEPIVTLILAIASLFVVMYLFGGFYGGMSSKMGGLGNFSFNINGFYNSQGKGYFLSNLPLTQGGQIEGFAYLGFGIFLLLLLSLFIEFSEKREHSKSRIISVTLAAVVFTVLALSPIITLNDKTLFTIPYPKFITDILSIFRSSGRFIWIPYYMLLIFVISRISQINKQGIKFALISAALALQITDGIKVYTDNYRFFATEKIYTSPLVSKEWDKFAKDYKHIMFYVPIWDIYVNPNLGYAMGFYAKENNMTLNGVYFSRDISQKTDPVTLEHFEQRRQGLRSTDTLYIFPTNTPPDLNKCGIDLFEIDGIKVGIPRGAK